MMSAGDPYAYPTINLGGGVEYSKDGNSTVLDSLSSAIGSGYSSARRVVFGENANNAKSSMSLMSLNYRTLLNFAICFMLGCLFFVMSFLFLPMVVIAPQKFTLLFTLGCLCWIVGLGVLQGYRHLLKAMLQRERLPFAVAYGFSLAGVFYSTLSAHSYFLTLMFAAFQIGSLGLFIMSYFPGGLKLISMLKEYVVSRFRNESFLPL